MLENQFIRLNIGSIIFSKKMNPLLCPMEEQGSGYRVFYEPRVSGATAQSIGIVDEADTLIDVIEPLHRDDGWFILFGEQGSYLERTEEVLSVGQRFFLRLEIVKDGTYYFQYSQPLIFVPRTGFSYVQYWCNEDAFGFPFQTKGQELQLKTGVSLFLPIRLHSPQNVQEDKTYVKSNGEVVTLYAKYYREWEGETEFLSAEMHDKIVAALSCDEVYIDGKRVTKSDNYQVDWENYDLDCDGVTKIARATFKVRENTNQRNSNF